MAKKFHSFLWGFWKTDKKIQQASEGQLPNVGGSDKDKMLHTNSSTGEVEWSNDYIKKSVGTQMGDMLVYNGSKWVRKSSSGNGYLFISTGSGGIAYVKPSIHTIQFTFGGDTYDFRFITYTDKFTITDSNTLSTWGDLWNTLCYFNEMFFIGGVRKNASNVVDCVYYAIDSYGEHGQANLPFITPKGYYLTDGALSMPICEMALSTAITDTRSGV